MKNLTWAMYLMAMLSVMDMLYNAGREYVRYFFFFGERLTK